MEINSVPLTRESGFVALMAALILGLVLITLATTLSMTGFFTRFNMADAEYKEQSLALAEACIQAVLFRIAQQPSYVPAAGGDVVTVFSNTCRIVSVTSAGTQLTIKTQGIFPMAPPEQSYTNLVVTINSTNLSISSWLEVP